MNNNNIPQYINYNQVLETRKCWYINCKCKGKLPAVGENRANGKSNKKDSGSRRFHTKCTSEYNERVENNVYSYEIDYETPEGKEKYSEIKLKYQLQYIKPEFRPFLQDYKNRKSYAITMSKRKK